MTATTRSYQARTDAIGWFTPSGASMTAADWADSGARSVAMVLSGSADPDIGDDGAPQVDDDLALLINAWWEPLTFSTTWDGPGDFTVESDSYQPERRNRQVTDGQVSVGPRSVVVLRKS